MGIENVCSKLKAPQDPEPLVLPFEKDEVQALVEACYKTRLAKTSKRRTFEFSRHEAYRDVATLFTLLDTGLRAEKLSRMNYADVDLRRRELEVKPYRSNRKSKPRTIFFSRDTQTCLLRWFT